MSVSRKIAHNTFIQILGRILSILLSLVIISRLTRYLGPEGFGQYTIIITFLSFFGILVDMGIYLTSLQLISQPGKNAEEIFSNAFTLRIISAIIFLGLAPLASIFFPYPPIVKQGIIIATLAFFFISLCQMLHAIFQKELNMVKAEISEIIGKIVTLAATIIAIYLRLNLLFIIITLVLGNFVHFLIKFIYAEKYLKIHFAFNKKIYKEIISNSWPIALSITFNLIYLRSDTIILSLFATKAQVGFYGAGYKVIDVLTTLPIIIAGLMLPYLVSAWANGDIEVLKKYLQAGFDVASILAIPIILGTQFIAIPFIELVAGKDFSPAGNILKILIIAVNMIFFSTLFTHLIVAINKQKIMLFGYFITAVLSLIAYFTLIPKFSAIGAAWVTVFSETLMAIIAFIVSYKSTKILPDFKILTKSLIAGILMSIILYFIRGFNMFLIILAGAIVYIGVLLVLKGINKEMIRDITKL